MLRFRLIRIGWINQVHMGISAMLRTRLAGYALVIAGLIGGASRAETIEEIEKKLTETYAKVTSYTAKVTVDMNMDTGDGNRTTSKSESTMEWMRKGDKVFMRADSKTSMTTNYGGQEMKMDNVSTTICDGEFLYSVSEMMGQKSAVKMAYDPKAAGDVTGMFKTLREQAELKVLPDEKVGDEDCYVIESTPKSAGASPMPGGGAMRMYFSKKTGMNLKAVALDDKGKPFSTTLTTDIKIGASIAADRFVFKAPEGVQVMDMTKQQP